jgi:response regulator of citrate/malate metabolism
VIKVLVVDDDFRVAAMHAQFVRRVAGFEVVGVAHTAAEAAEIAARLRPDLACSTNTCRTASAPTSPPASAVT